MSFATRSPLTGVVLGLVMACGGGGDGNTGPDPNAVQTVVVTPSSATITAIGSTASLSAQARNSSGAPIAGKTFSWTSENSNVAIPDGAGVVTAAGNGTATIRATVVGGTQSGTATVTVQQAINTISLTTNSATIEVSGTTQIAVSALDPNGSPIAPQFLSWVSSNTLVATVNATGLVTGVGPGTATITVGTAPKTATFAVTVLPRSLSIGQDTTMSGTVAVNQFIVPAGRTVTINGSLDLAADGLVSIAGTITGACTPVSIVGDTAVVITGTVANGCDAGTDANLRLVSNGELELTNATITSSGDITLSNNPALDESNFPAFVQGTSGPRAAAANSGVKFSKFNNSTVKYHGNRGRGAGPNPAADGANGNPGQPGANGRAVQMFLDGDALWAGNTTIWGQDGGNGGNSFPANSTSNLSATAGPGGRGGKISVLVTGTLTYGGSGNIVRAGRGGNGGTANATTLENAGSGPLAPAATATGGDGGEAGLIDMRAGVGIAINGPDALTLELTPGDGGDAFAKGAKGANASGDTPAQIGGDATATGGRGGDTPDATLHAAGLVTGDQPIIIADGGIGGSATADAGKGGNGNKQKKAGNTGGIPRATGGEGGDANLRNAQGQFVGFGGGSGRAIFKGGDGGNGFAGCDAGQEEDGGNGGAGASLGTQVRGRGGRGASPGPDSESEFNNVGNGGDGGGGVVPGQGGAAGTGPVGPRRVGGPPPATEAADTFIGKNFTPGQPGVACGLQPNPAPPNNDLFMQVSGWPASSQGFVSPGTYTRPLLNGPSGTVVGEVLITTIFAGSFTAYTFGESPPRIGQSNGQSTGWDLNLASVKEGIMFPNTESFTLCFLGENPPPSPANPIVVIQRDNFGAVLTTDNITGPGGPIADGRAGCRTFGRHLNATHARWFRGGTGTTHVDRIAFKKKPNP
jgi:hypothetical protein